MPRTRRSNIRLATALAIASTIASCTNPTSSDTTGNKLGQAVELVAFCNTYGNHINNYAWETIRGLDQTATRTALEHAPASLDRIDKTAPATIANIAHTWTEGNREILGDLKAAGWDQKAIETLNGEIPDNQIDETSALDLTCNRTSDPDSHNDNQEHAGGNQPTSSADRPIDNPTSDNPVETTADNFARWLETIAYFGFGRYTVDGNIGSTSDTASNRSVHLLYMLHNVDIPHQNIATNHLSASDVRVLVYNGNTWTRLTCDTATAAKCPGAEYDNIAGELIGDNETGKLPGPWSAADTTGALDCIQIHQNGHDTYIGWNSTDTHGEPLAHDDNITSACGNIHSVDVDETGHAHYSDLGGHDVEDLTWGK